MNTSEMAVFDSWDEKELAALVARFVRRFHRLPSGPELAEYHRSRTRLRVVSAT